MRSPIKPTGRRAVLGKRNRQRAQARKAPDRPCATRSPFGGQSIASKPNGKNDGGQGRVALRRIASATATRIEEAGVMRLRSRCSKKLFQILDRHATARSASGDSGEVGRVKAEFGHPRLHARRQIGGSCGMRWHRQSVHGRLDLTWCRRARPGVAASPCCEAAFAAFPRVPTRLPLRASTSTYPRIAPTG